ncbi:hypothetical protein A2U01_0060259, partial [Trifolium medium]|nr:hypothetical protein [Trifolium medium]
MQKIGSGTAPCARRRGSCVRRRGSCARRSVLVQVELKLRPPARGAG